MPRTTIVRAVRAVGAAGLALLLVVVASAGDGTPAPGDVRCMHEFAPDNGIDLTTPTLLARTTNALDFVAGAPGSGREIWRVTGRDAAPEFVVDTLPGPWGISVGSYLGEIPASNVTVMGDEFTFGVGTSFWHIDADGVASTIQVAAYWWGNTSARALGRAGGFVLLSNTTDAHGTELHVWDPGDDATQLLVDIAPGTANSDPGASTQLGDIVLFAASDAAHGRELWRSDGTADGTHLLIDLAPGAASSSPRPLLLLDGELLFWADDAGGATSLWRTDGTADGTALVFAGGDTGLSDVPAGIDTIATYDAARPDAVELADGSMLFVAKDDAHGRELWRTDGTSEGTALVIDLNRVSGSSSPILMGSVGGVAIFSADDGGQRRALFRTDGTSAGTEQFAYLPPLSFGGARALDVALDDVILFVADHVDRGPEIWGTDGTTEGTRLRFDLAPGPATPFVRPWLPNSAFYTGMAAAFDGVVWFDAFSRLHVTDGAPAGTKPVYASSDGIASTSPPKSVTPRGDRLYVEFYGTAGSLFVDDGSGGLTAATAPGTRTDDDGLTAPTAALADSLLFFTTETTPVFQNRMWVSDGIGLDMVTTVPVGPNGGGFAHALEWRDGFAFFSGGGQYRNALWRTDATAAGTFMLRDEVRPIEYAEWNGDTYAILRVTQYAAELVKSDGTAAGTSLVAALDVAAGAGMPGDLTVFDDQLLFVHSGSLGVELWSTDGTAAGTGVFLDVESGTGSSNPAELTVCGDHLFFTRSESYPAPRSLQRLDTDGTVTRVLDSAEEMAAPLELIDVDGTLFFTALGDGTGRELWKTDGSAAGTQLVRDIECGVRTSNIAGIVSVGSGRAVFVAATVARGVELWATDGTENGTRLVADIAPGPASSNPSNIAVFDGDVVFHASPGGAASVLYAIAIADLADLPTTPSCEASSPRSLGVRALGPSPGVPPDVGPPGPRSPPGPPPPPPPPEPEALELSSLHVRMPLRNPRRDTLRMTGRLPVPEGFEPEGEIVVVDVGGHEVTFTLDCRGRSVKTVDGHKLRIALRRRGRGKTRTVRGNERAKFTIEFARTDLQASLADEDLNVPEGEKRVVRAIGLTVGWRDKTYVATAVVDYFVRRNVGRARLK